MVNWLVNKYKSILGYTLRGELFRHLKSCLIDINDCVVLVNSTIRFSLNPLCYTNQRSIYSPEERLKQTLQTITSVRAKIPNCLVILLENSDLTSLDNKQLCESVDWMVRFNTDQHAVALRDGLYKGAAEAYMLYKIMRVLKPFNYKRLLKVSGRYWLTNNFLLEKFPLDRFGVRMTQGVYSTRLYCVPKALEEIYLRQLARMLRLAKWGTGIEAVFLKGVRQNLIAQLPYVGVSGYIAVDGTLIDE